MKVYLDDEREAPKGWIRTFTPLETIELLKSGDVTEISLDHDLGLEYDTGYDVILWIEYEVFVNDFNAPIIKVHSANSSARIKMELGIDAIMRYYEIL